MSADFWLGLANEKCGRTRREKLGYPPNISFCLGFYLFCGFSSSWPDPLWFWFQLILVLQFWGCGNIAFSLILVAKDGHHFLLLLILDYFTIPWLAFLLLCHLCTQTLLLNSFCYDYWKCFVSLEGP